MHRCYKVCCLHRVPLSFHQVLVQARFQENTHTKSHTHMQRLMHKHRYAHRGQLWANNSVVMKPCAEAEAYRCISTKNPDNTWLCSDSNAEHHQWSDNRWPAQGERHKNGCTQISLAWNKLHCSFWCEAGVYEVWTQGVQQHERLLMWVSLQTPGQSPRIL